MFFFSFLYLESWELFPLCFLTFDYVAAGNNEIDCLFGLTNKETTSYWGLCEYLSTEIGWLKIIKNGGWKSYEIE